MQEPFLLPIAIVSPMDIARLVRELKNLDEYFAQNSIRSGGEAPEIPRYSRLLDSLIVANKLDLVEPDHRQSLLDRFTSMQESAPVMHISFSTDPPGAYVQKIVGWLRQNIHPLILVRVGLQPNIGAGCIVRTTNKAFDFSLRQYFDTKHEFFVKKLHDVVVEQELAEQSRAQKESIDVGSVVNETQVSQPVTESSTNEQAVQAPTEELSPEQAENQAQSVPVEVQS